MHTTSRAITRLGSVIKSKIMLNSNGIVLQCQVRRLVFFVIRSRPLEVGQQIETQNAIRLRILNRFDLRCLKILATYAQARTFLREVWSG